MAGKRGYSPELTDAAHTVLMEVLTVLGTYVERGDVVLVGGWAPYFLTKMFPRPGTQIAHIGTSDVDLLLNLQALKDKTYASIRRALLRAGYKNREGHGADFVFEKTLKPKSGPPVLVQVDLLGPVYGGTGKARRHQRVQGEQLARKVEGGDLALRTFVTIEVSGRMPDGAMNRHRVRVAGIPAVIAMKGLVVGNRMKEIDPRKDAYDLYMLITYYKGGPRDVAAEVKPFLHHSVIKRALCNIAAKFASADSVGPCWAAEMMEPRERAGQDRIARDAFEQVALFLRELSRGASKESEGDS